MSNTEVAIIVAPGAPTLGEIAEVANREHSLAYRSGEAMIEHAILAGEALVAAKEQLAHGEWLPWLAANFEGSEPTAQRYMRIALNPSRVTDLPEPSLRKALAALFAASRPDEAGDADDSDSTTDDARLFIDALEAVNGLRAIPASLIAAGIVPSSVVRTRAMVKRVHVWLGEIAHELDNR